MPHCGHVALHLSVSCITSCPGVLLRRINPNASISVMLFFICFAPWADSNDVADFACFPPDWGRRSITGILRLEFAGLLISFDKRSVTLPKIEIPPNKTEIYSTQQYEKKDLLDLLKTKIHVFLIIDVYGDFYMVSEFRGKNFMKCLSQSVRLLILLMVT
jgi:hypothetical protein